jgi:hypothetical protein
MIKIWQWLKGSKTYIMAAVIGVDAAGVALGWWPEGQFRHVLEGIGTIMALRAGIEANGQTVQPKVK